MRIFQISLLICLLISSCKVNRSTTRLQPEITEDDTIDVDVPTYWITQLGDTLLSLDDEVAIALNRVLPDTITLAAVGDIMMGTSFPNKSYLPRENGAFLWNGSRTFLQNADIAFGNLEGTLLDGEGEPKNCKNPSACFLFKMPAVLSDNLRECGFDLMSIANNHANDFGPAGRKSTRLTLDSLNIQHAGSIEVPYSISKVGYLDIGLVAFSPNKGTLTFHDTTYAASIVQKLDSMADLVIVSIHGGAEGAKNQHVTRKTEFYYGENRGNIYAFSRKMIDHGADVILGHGPHVPRALDIYKNKLIAYSLGNFLTYGRFNLKRENGLAPLLTARLSNEGDFLHGQILSFVQSYVNGPIPDSKHRAALKIKELTEEDFPDSVIKIDEVGRISYLQN